MPQGAFKKKSGASGVGKKQKATQKKKAQLKKGARFIAPKKANLVEAQKAQKSFTKSLKAELEGDLSAKATHVESKSFKVLSTKSKPAAKTSSKT